MATVDVIVPCYKYGHFLRECVESVLAQSLRTVRVLIIDDASPDATAEVATQLMREDPRVAFIRHAANRGHIETYNEGIEWASADYMLLLSADDVLLPGALMRATRFMDDRKEVGLIHGGWVDYHLMASLSPLDDEDGTWHLSSGAAFLTQICATGQNPICTPTAIVRTTLQKGLGGYRAELPHSGDLEMWMRFAAHSAVARVDKPLAVRRRHDRNMSSEFYATVVQDYFQRKAAFDAFFDSFADKIPEGRRLQANAYRTLAEQMFWTGIGQFCRRNRRTSQQLLSLAFELRPDLRFRPPLSRLLRIREVDRRIRDALAAAVGRAGAV
jgi:hypothetical protein